MLLCYRHETNTRFDTLTLSVLPCVWEGSCYLCVFVGGQVGMRDKTNVCKAGLSLSSSLWCLLQLLWGEDMPVPARLTGSGLSLNAVMPQRGYESQKQLTDPLSFS